MLDFLASIWNWITSACAALMPFQRGQKLSPAVRWLIWILLDLLLMAVLYFLNDFLKINQLVTNLGPLEQFRANLQHWWLPIFGQLVILLAVILYWFYLLWFSSADDSPFPDIDAAWQEAVDALAKVGVRPPQLPLYLVLGRPGTSEDHLFEAASLKPAIPPTPANKAAPLRVFAGRVPGREDDVIVVTCRGASLLGKLAGLFAMENLADGSPIQDGEVPDEADKTQRPSSNLQMDIAEMLRAPDQQNPLKKRARRRFAFQGKPLGSDFMADAREVARCKARLAHLCRLIMRDRQPYCGINGILLLVPLAGTDTTGEAQLTAQAAHDDLGIVRNEMKLECPVISMVVDVEDLPGFAEFMQRTAKDLRNRRGSGFPMESRLTREQIVREIKKSLEWVCGNYLQDSVYPVFQIETQANMDAHRHFPENANMVLLLGEMNARAEALNMIIQHAVAPPADSLFRYAGCYLGATGPKGRQGFVEGVLRKLIEEQSSVSWTKAAFVEDAESQRWANYYCAIAVVLFLIVVVAVVAKVAGWF